MRIKVKQLLTQYSPGLQWRLWHKLVEEAREILVKRGGPTNPALAHVEAYADQVWTEVYATDPDIICFDTPHAAADPEMLLALAIDEFRKRLRQLLDRPEPPPVVRGSAERIVKALTTLNEPIASGANNGSNPARTWKALSDGELIAAVMRALVADDVEGSALIEYLLDEEHEAFKTEDAVFFFRPKTDKSRRLSATINHSAIDTYHGWRRGTSAKAWDRITHRVWYRGLQRALAAFYRQREHASLMDAIRHHIPEEYWQRAVLGDWK